MTPPLADAGFRLVEETSRYADGSEAVVYRLEARRGDASWALCCTIPGHWVARRALAYCLGVAARELDAPYVAFHQAVE